MCIPLRMPKCMVPCGLVWQIKNKNHACTTFWMFDTCRAFQWNTRKNTGALWRTLCCERALLVCYFLFFLQCFFLLFCLFRPLTMKWKNRRECQVNWQPALIKRQYQWVHCHRLTCGVGTSCFFCIGKFSALKESRKLLMAMLVCLGSDLEAQSPLCWIAAVQNIQDKYYQWT